MSRLFNLLNVYYGSNNVWVEVEDELKKSGANITFDDFYNPFKNLVIGVLSQNTSDRNSVKACVGLIKQFKKITPLVLAKAPFGQIRNAIRPGGLYNLKAKRIKDLSQAILDRYAGDLTKITRLGKKKAREELLSFSGIGPKTADVFIGYCMKSGEALPIDTNIKRVVVRIGIVKKGARYDEIRKLLRKRLPSGKELKGHEFLIRLGRDFCKPKNPLCNDCPVKAICISVKKRLGINGN
ncbi:MAG TPA: hypothetical protein VMX76_02860 [Nevskiaceae bacterium]|nr:hypothetical protein [Nevskiaceae bacterium]